jgi:hypothetical protein
MAYEWMMPVVALSTMSQSARDRAVNPLMLTMLPVAPAMRGPLAAVALTQQAESSVRDERQAVDQTVRAVRLAATTPGGLSARQIRELPALSDADRESLANRINSAVGSIVAPAVGSVVSEAIALIKVVQEKKSASLEDVDLAKDYPTLAKHFDKATLAGKLEDMVKAPNGGSTESVEQLASIPGSPPREGSSEATKSKTPRDQVRRRP